MDDPAPDQEFMDELTEQVDICIKHGVYPILAYGATLLENGTQTEEQDKDHLASWWRKMANHFKGYSYMLSYNILI